MGSFIYPVRSARISSPFGNRIHPINHKSSFHRGVDLACPSGTSIYATRAGKVVLSGYNGSYGKCVKVQHANGILSLYAHCSSLLVSSGQSVKAGQTIARVGSTGNSTGPHLHFEIQIGGSPKNPLNYVRSSDTISNFSGEVGVSSGGTDATTGTAGATEPAEKEITKIVLKTTDGKSGKYKFNDLITASDQSKSLNILIQNDKIYAPVVKGKITIERQRKLSPDTMKLEVLNDDVIHINVGNPIAFRYQENKVFYGYIFKIETSDSEVLKLTCYDQIRYLKAKDTLIYKNKTYSDLVKMIAKDHGLKVGSIESTKTKKTAIEETTLLDMLLNISSEETLKTGKIYNLFDDFGKLTLKSLEKMFVPILIDSDTSGGFNYSTSIDSNTYNKVKLAFDNKKTGEREVKVFNDETSQSKYGVLQYYEKLDSTEAVIKEKGKVLLKNHRWPEKKLSIKNCFGDIRVRGGSSLLIGITPIKKKQEGLFIVEKVTHTFEHGYHMMDIDVAGGGIVG
ncbi:MAG: M23 family metallopeptidase [Anaerovoracaceae bacterium]